MYMNIRQRICIISFGICEPMHRGLLMFLKPAADHRDFCCISSQSLTLYSLYSLFLFSFFFYSSMGNCHCIFCFLFFSISNLYFEYVLRLGYFLITSRLENKFYEPHVLDIHTIYIHKYSFRAQNWKSMERWLIMG